MKSSKTMLYACAALALVAGVLAAAVLQPRAAARFEAIDVTGAPWGRDFRLTDHAGQARSLADFRGKAVAVFFGFTHCPDVCPTALAQLTEVMKLLGEDARRLQVLFVTLDPRRDTPAVLAQYVPAFHPSFLGLHGDAAAIDRTAKEFKIYYQVHAANDQGAYSVDHSAQILVFDPRGRLRLLVKPELPPAAMARDVRALLESGS